MIYRNSNLSVLVYRKFSGKNDLEALLFPHSLKSFEYSNKFEYYHRISKSVRILGFDQIRNSIFEYVWSIGQPYLGDYPNMPDFQVIFFQKFTPDFLSQFFLQCD